MEKHVPLNLSRGTSFVRKERQEAKKEQAGRNDGMDLQEDFGIIGAMMNMNSDTIAAIATAPGEGAIAIVRISGPESVTIADRIFRSKGPLPSRRQPGSFVHGRIASGDVIADEVILLIYRAPHSYTGEDSIEIQGHGGPAAAQRILRAVVEAGGRIADPGEFTKRAFLNGRIDLLQAEAVLDLIRARSDRAAAAALEQLEGGLSRTFGAIYDQVLIMAADIEVTLDFADEDLPPDLMSNLRGRLISVEMRLKDLLASWDEGHILREGALIVIGGKPNVGKSTLLNRLLGVDRAIVNRLPGTTRDIIEENMVIDGYPVRLVDTAGLRQTDCEIEGEGIRRARQYVQRADILIYIVDGSQPMDREDIDCLAQKKSGKTILVANKADIGIDRSYMTNTSILSCSLLEVGGADMIMKRIGEKLSGLHSGQQRSVISERHRRLVIMALKDITEATLLINIDQPDPALAASRLRSALDALGEATGRVYHDELLNSIFSRFCIGK
jgi:tRNA modification GTPase